MAKPVIGVSVVGFLYGAGAVQIFDEAGGIRLNQPSLSSHDDVSLVNTGFKHGGFVGVQSTGGGDIAPTIVGNGGGRAARRFHLTVSIVSVMNFRNGMGLGEAVASHRKRGGGDR